MRVDSLRALVGNTQHSMQKSAVPKLVYTVLELGVLKYVPPPAKKFDHPVWLNGENVPCVVLPLRVTVKLFVLLSRKVLFWAPFVPFPGRSRVVRLN
jgi:hypothetical protein